MLDDDRPGLVSVSQQIINVSLSSRINTTSSAFYLLIRPPGLFYKTIFHNEGVEANSLQALDLSVATL